MNRLSGCVIRNADGELLLLHRNTPRLTQWELPGGKVEDGETEQDAAIRELNEELAIIVTVVRKLGEAELHLSDTAWNYSWFEAIILEGVPVVNEPKTFDDVAYISLRSLESRQDLSQNLTKLLESGCLKP